MRVMGTAAKISSQLLFAVFLASDADAQTAPPPPPQSTVPALLPAVPKSISVPEVMIVEPPQPAVAAPGLGQAKRDRAPERVTKGATSSPAVRAVQRLPAGIAIEPSFGVQVEDHGDGPVQGYRALTSATATKTGAALIDTPQSVQVLPRQLLNDQAVNSLPEAMKNVAGVTGAFGFNGGGNACARVRGFSTEQGTVGCTYYLDGVRVWGQPQPFAAIERVEVVKGPNSVLFGRNEPGGMINLVTKTAEGERIRSVQQTIGSRGTSITQVDIGGVLDEGKTLAGRVNASFSTADSFRDRAFDELSNVNAALSWKPQTGTRIDFGLDYSKQVYGADYGIPALGNKPAPVPLHQSYMQNYVDSKTEAILGRAKLSQKLDDAWRVETGIMASYLKPSYLDVYGFGLDETTLKYPVFYTSEQYSWRRTIQGNVDLKGDVSLFGIRHKLLIGGDANHERYDAPFFITGSTQTLDLFNPQIGSAERLYPTRADFTPYGGIQKWYGVYAHDEMQVSDQLTVNFGARFDRATFAFSPDPKADAITETAISPRLGVVYKPISNLSLFAQYQEGFGPGNGRSSTGTPLAGETAISYETGVKWATPDQSLLASVTMFHLRKQNVKSADPSTPDPTDAIATGEVRNRGIEVDVTGRLNDKVSIVGTYAYSDAVISKDAGGNQGKRYEGVPQHAGSLWARYQYNANWAFGTGVFAESQRQGDLGNTFALPGYVRADVMAQYRFVVDSARWTAQANVTNVFDTAYYAGVHKNSRDFIMPGAPRTFLFSLRTDF